MCQWACCTGGRRQTYAVQNDGDGPLGVKGGLLAAQLRDLADEEDVAADEAVEVRRGDAGGGQLLSHCVSVGVSGLLMNGR